MALRAITAKGVAVGIIVAVVASAWLLLRLPRRSAGPPAVLTSRALPVVLVSLSGLPPREWTAPESREDVLAPPARPRLIPSRTLAVHTPSVQQGRGSGLFPAPSVDETEAPLLASRPIALVSVDVAVDEQKTGETSRSGAITRAMGTTGRAFRVAGTSVASAFKKVF